MVSVDTRFSRDNTFKPGTFSAWTGGKLGIERPRGQLTISFLVSPLCLGWGEKDKISIYLVNMNLSKSKL
jgi:hypothetical protein